MISSIIFVAFFIAGTTFFFINAKKIRRNILLGKNISITDNKAERLKTMILVALGQKKMFTRPIPALLHLCLYAAFVITQIELIEIIFDDASNSYNQYKVSRNLDALLMPEIQVYS